MRELKNAAMDNSRWNGFTPRAGDIFVCTPAKCGTTWMQTIVANLLWPDGNFPGQIVNGIAPWIEAKFGSADAMHAMLNAQTFRRAMKSHSPADCIPWFPQAKYITVVRDGRDAFMSWCNHVSRMKLIDMMNAQAEAEGLLPQRKFDGDYRAYFRHWLDEPDNFFDVVATFWAKRDEPNLLFAHYNDLKADLDGEMRRVAKFLGIEIPQAKWPAVVERCTFEAMRNAEADPAIDDMFEGGVKGFIFKGTNGRWRDVLTEDDVGAYRRRVEEMLPADAARFVEGGRHAVGIA